MVTLDIADNWVPTPANVNALPLPLRMYIMDLQGACPCAEAVQQAAVLSDQVAQLEAALARAKEKQ